MLYTTHPTPISQIRVGDTVEIDGRLRTVSGTDLRRGGFMGTTLFGDSFRCGSVPVQRVEFQRAQPTP